MAVEVGAAVFQQHVGEIIQPALGGDAGLKLTHSAGCGIARVGKNGQAFLLALLVHLLEGGNGHEHLASDFEAGRDSGLLQLLH